jgi:hypothetical protein
MTAELPRQQYRDKKAIERIVPASGRYLTAALGSGWESAGKRLINVHGCDRIVKQEKTGPCELDLRPPRARRDIQEQDVELSLTRSDTPAAACRFGRWRKPLWANSSNSGPVVHAARIAVRNVNPGRQRSCVNQRAHIQRDTGAGVKRNKHSD